MNVLQKVVTDWCKIKCFLKERRLLAFKKSFNNCSLGGYIKYKHLKIFHVYFLQYISYSIFPTVIKCHIVKFDGLNVKLTALYHTNHPVSVTASYHTNYQVGHVDAGKSTLMGHLLCLLGVVSKKELHKNKMASQKIGKGSFAYAWVLDETGEERERGVTIDVAQTKFETSKKTVNLLDAPGHKDFVPNMISGASQADVAILVVDSTQGGFEAGFEQGGQTREHVVLVRALGVQNLIVAVNKMENVDWSKDRFDYISKELLEFFKNVGFKRCDSVFVPVSGLEGDNLLEKSTTPQLLLWCVLTLYLQRYSVI